MTHRIQHKFARASQVTEEVAAHLKEAGVEVKDYGLMLADVRALAAEGVRMWADPSKVSCALLQAATEGGAPAQGADAAVAGGGSPRGKGGPPPAKRQRGGAAAPAAAGAGATPAKAAKGVFLQRASPVTAAKAVKNEAELAGMREAHLRDAVALAQTLLWVEQQVGSARSQGGRVCVFVWSQRRSACSCARRVGVGVRALVERTWLCMHVGVSLLL